VTALPAGAVLCRAEDIAEGSGRGFEFGAGRERTGIFVIRWRGEWRAYRNACPHAGSPLDWQPDRFFTRDGRFLLCATHGARFEPGDGRCISGPCAGRGLTPVALATDATGCLVLA